jgi:hypothetical protein
MNVKIYHRHLESVLNIINMKLVVAVVLLYAAYIYSSFYPSVRPFRLAPYVDMVINRRRVLSYEHHLSVSSTTISVVLTHDVENECHLNRLFKVTDICQLLGQIYIPYCLGIG